MAAIIQDSLFDQLPVAPVQPASHRPGKRKTPLALDVCDRRQRRLVRQQKVEQACFENFEQEALGVSLKDLASQVTRFASGVLSPAYWKAYRSAGRPLCVAATELGSRALERVCQHAADGGTLLLDSGAFVYREAHTSMPWARVLKVYAQVAASASPEARLTFILPDAVGSQESSLKALREWGNRIIKAVGPTHEVLLPIQRGDMKPSELIEKSIDLLDHPISGIAIPCKAKAFPVEHLADLGNVSDDRVPRRVHFLGVSNDQQKLESYLYHLHRIWPEATVSCDAVEHRALVGQGEIITEIRHEILEGPIHDAALNAHDHAAADDDELDALVRERLAHQYGLNLEDAEDQDTLDALMVTQHASSLEYTIKTEQAKKRFGAWATAAATNAVARSVEPYILSHFWAQVTRETA